MPAARANISGDVAQLAEHLACTEDLVGSNPTGAMQGDVAQRLRALACQASTRRFESGRPRSPPENPARFAGHDDFPAFDFGVDPTVISRRRRSGSSDMVVVV